MSDLYSRLKAVSSARRQSAVQPAPKPEPEPPKACGEILRAFDALRGHLPDMCHVAAMMGLEKIAGSVSCDPERLLFLDTETTGLGGGAGTLAFLVGLGRISGSSFHTRQLWMRDYDEEEGLLDALEAELADCSAVVTYNGRTFDIPLLESRFAMYRRRMPPVAHIDLLTHARRIYRLRMKSVRLTMVEEMLLGHIREGDIPGSEIPAMYFEFLKSRDDKPLRPVFDHNAQDIFSLASILRRISEAYTAPETLRHGEDVYSVGRDYERRGDRKRAIECYRLASKEYTVRAVEALSFAYKRDNMRDAAIEGFLRIADRSAQANVELAKYYEHRLKNLDLALEHTDAAIRMTPNGRALERLFLRRRRIIDKLTKRGN